MNQEDFTWYGAGWACFKDEAHPDFLPPLNDLDAQHEWLEGFCAADMEYNVFPTSPTTVEELQNKLSRHPELLQQLICFLGRQ